MSSVCSSVHWFVCVNIVFLQRFLFRFSMFLDFLSLSPLFHNFFPSFNFIRNVLLSEPFLYRSMLLLSLFQVRPVE